MLTSDCPSTCYDYDCDFWVDNYADLDYTCASMELQFSCDCSGCLCGAPPPSPLPTTSPVPTMTQRPTTSTDVTTFYELSSAIASHAQINVAQDIRFEQPITISGKIKLAFRSLVGAVLSGEGFSGSFGGLFKIEEGSDVTFSGLQFAKGTATQYGGCLYVTGSHVEVEDAGFTECVADEVSLLHGLPSYQNSWHKTNHTLPSSSLHFDSHTHNPPVHSWLARGLTHFGWITWCVNSTLCCMAD